MKVPRSLRIARLLLFAAGALVVGTVAYIGVASSDPRGAWPWIALLLLNAIGFFLAARSLTRDERRAKLLAVASAIGMAALGTISGFGAGMLSFPAAGIGALGAWATLLYPPRRRMIVAFVVYTAIGLVLVGPGALLFPLLLPTVFIWPARLLLFMPSSIVAIYLFLGIAASMGIAAFVRPRAFAPRPTALSWALAIGIASIAGASAAILFQLIATARDDTSLRFELDPVVIAVVFAGGALAALGIAALRLRPGIASATALGLGAGILFMTFSYRPAVTCAPNGNSNSLPLSWALRSAFERGQSYSSSGSSGASIGGGSGSVATGRFQSGDREAVFRCDGARLVEYREVPR